MEQLLGQGEIDKMKYARKLLSIGGVEGAGPVGGNSGGPDTPYWVWYCRAMECRGMVPMMILNGTWRSKAGPDGSTINFIQFIKDRLI